VEHAPAWLLPAGRPLWGTAAGTAPRSYATIAARPQRRSKAMVSLCSAGMIPTSSYSGPPNSSLFSSVKQTLSRRYVFYHSATPWSFQEIVKMPVRKSP